LDKSPPPKKIFRFHSSILHKMFAGKIFLLRLIFEA
jgi:hypothetical protein